MLANYEEYGFQVQAKTLPQACTACPFWEGNMYEPGGMCGITGIEDDTDGDWDKKRMSDCPIEECKGEQSAKMKRKMSKVAKKILEYIMWTLIFFWISICIGCGIAYGFFRASLVILGH